MTWFRRVLIGVDQLFNAVGNGDPDETISSRVGKAARAGKRWGLTLETIIDAFLGAGHCRASIETDEGER